MGATIWQKCLDRLEDELTSQQFNTWIRPLQAVDDADGVRLLAPNRYIRDQVQDNFLNRIRELIAQGGFGRVDLEIGSTGKVNQREPAPNTFATRERFYPLLDLNKDFTFDTFVEGRSNQLARAAAFQVSENVGGASYNPLLLYGGVGLGKTHLMHAVGNSIAAGIPT